MSAPYELALPASSSLFVFAPSRDGDVLETWNATYTGSPVWPGGGADSSKPEGTAYRRTQFGKAGFNMAFEGTVLWLCLRSNGAGYHLSVDGAAQTSIGVVEELCKDYLDAEPDMRPDTVLVTQDLEPGRHSAVLDVSASAQNEFRFWGGGIVMRLPTAGHVVEEVEVDDQADGWVFSPASGDQAWQTSTGVSGMYQNTATSNCVYGAGITAAYRFNDASGLILKGHAWSQSKAFSVQLDNQVTGMYATTSWEDGSAVFFVSGTLDPSRSHTITLINYNSEDSDCPAHRNSLCCIGFDSIVLLRAGTELLPSGGNDTHVTRTGTLDPTSTPGTYPTSQPTDAPAEGDSLNAGIIAGVALGATAALLAGALLIICFLRRRKRRQKEMESPSAFALQDRSPSQQWSPYEIEPFSAAPLLTPYVPPVHPTGSTSSLQPPRPVYVLDTKSTPSVSGQTTTAPTSGMGGPRSDNDTDSTYETVIFSDDAATTPSARASTMPSIQASTLPSGARLTNEDLDHVLTLLAHRIDRPSPLRHSVLNSDTGDSDLPAYREPGQ